MEAKQQFVGLLRPIKMALPRIVVWPRARTQSAENRAANWSA